MLKVAQQWCPDKVSRLAQIRSFLLASQYCIAQLECVATWVVPVFFLCHSVGNTLQAAWAGRAGDVSGVQLGGIQYTCTMRAQHDDTCLSCGTVFLDGWQGRMLLFFGRST